MKNFITIGNIKIVKTAALAPMAGVTNKAFREISKRYGASYMISEMVSAKAICYGDKKTEKLLTLSDIDHPIAIQLFGSEPECLAKAAYMILKYKPDIIDINMGCPVKKITSNNSGSSLMRNPKLVSKIVNYVVKNVNIPITIKIRSGWDNDNINAVEIAKIAESNGASAITIHGRTKQQMYSYTSSLDIIKKVKDAVNIPVIGNGDIIDVKSAVNMYKVTGCDLIMIGRGALGNPWIFKQIDNYFNHNIISQEPSINEKISVMREHINLLIKYSLSENIAIKESRKYINWYLKGFRNSAIIRNKVSKINTINDLNDIINHYIIGETN